MRQITVCNDALLQCWVSCYVVLSYGQGKQGSIPWQKKNPKSFFPAALQENKFIG
jgi:hypothetical protein